MADCNPIMTDAQVAALLGVSLKTLQRRVRSTPPAGEIDLRKAEPKAFGGRRFWLRSKVEKLIGIN